MKRRRFEIFIALVLTAISYLGNYYLKEPLVTAGVAEHSLIWHAVNILWLLAMVGIGYWGLIGHELKWVKSVWIIVHVVLFIILLGNKLTLHFWHRPFIPDGTSTMIRSPFFFLMAAFIPRWFMRYRSPEKDENGNGTA